jgi:hypothetical protein
MATFVHLTDIRNSQKIMRNGIRPTMTKATGKVVYCVPVVSNFQITFQWLRELKREGYRTASAIQFKIADTEHVLVGRYRQPKSEMTAAQDVAFFQGADDARGYEVIIARGIKPKEITRIRSIPQLIGWRFYPEAKGSPPWYQPRGTVRASCVRRSIERRG